MSSFHNNALVGASGLGGYQIERSLRFNSADSTYLSATLTTPTNNKKWTYSCWLKRTGFLTTLFDVPLLTSATNAGALGISGTGAFGGTLDGKFFHASAAGTYYYVNVEFRDPSAWYHFVFVADTDNATGDNRQILYVNGVRQPNFSSTIAPSTALALNSARAHFIGGYAGGGATPAAGYYANGYLTEVHFIDGQALTPSSFGETDTITGVWKPKKYSGSGYGTNGFYLKFADNSGTTSTTLGKDSSGNGNNWTPNNFSVTAGAGNDSMIDTPTPYADGGNGRGNYCTWLPQKGGQTWTFSNGNLDAVNGNAGSFAYSCIGTIAVSTGKWYWEVTCNDAGPTTLRVPGVGIMGSERNVLSTAATVRPDVYLSGNGTIDNSAGTALQSGFSNMAAGDVVGVALDADAKTVQFYRNGSAVGTAQSYTAAFVTPSFYSYNTFDCNANFGQRAFAYTPPSGFKALNTQNLPEPLIKKPSSYMDVKLYTGNSSTQTISGLGFSPDLVWIKSRSNAYNHGLQDTVRGAGKTLYSNLTNAEDTQTSVTAFNSDGFSLANDSWNQSAVTYAAWCWDESATPGFDIVTYTGTGVARTVSHSLGVVPNMIIVKTITTAGKNWAVYHSANGTPQNNVVYLNLTANTNSSAGQWNSTAPTSSVFTVSGSPTSGYDDVNLNGSTYVAYLWSEVAGFSKFGSYTGNGGSDGPFVFCGFRPRFILQKPSTVAYGWNIFDTARSDSNATKATLQPNLNNAEGNFTNGIDITSNGFKIRDSAAELNQSGQTYIFAAFAESPQKYSLAR